MTKRKLFGVNASLTQALTDTVKAASHYTGELHIEIIPIRKIELDPDNPRSLALNFKDLQEGISKNDEKYEQKTLEKDKLSSLANSITNQGIINPILVYKLGNNYRLIAGERRTLASVLANKEDIPAKILPHKPDALKTSLLQWIENIEREDLSLWERLTNLEMIMDAYSIQQHKSVSEVTPTELSQLVICSIPQAINYKHVIQAPNKIRNLIKENKIKNIEKASLIAKANPIFQDQLIEACLNKASLKALKALEESLEKQGRDKNEQKRGRKAHSVSFGSSTNLKVAKILIQSVLNEEKFSNHKANFGGINWNDYRSVTQAFKSIIKLIEKTAS